jgi:hypothetical protein
MPNYGYHLARAQARLVESSYRALLPLILRRRIKCKRELPIDVFSYSGQQRLAEQVVSIRSFLKYAGRPTRFVVVSDGSHSDTALELLRAVDDCVSLEVPPASPPQTAESLANYLNNHPTGKQLALLVSLPRERPALYLDSDVRFFPAAHELSDYLVERSTTAYYLLDCGFAGDERLLNSAEEKSRPVNIGALLIFRSLDWSGSFDRFAQRGVAPTFFTGQTLTHLAMHANGARPFDPAKFVVQLDDQFVYGDHHAAADLVLRHYVNPVRHKLWTSLWR